MEAVPRGLEIFFEREDARRQLALPLLSPLQIWHNRTLHHLPWDVSFLQLPRCPAATFTFVASLIKGSYYRYVPVSLPERMWTVCLIFFSFSFFFKFKTLWFFQNSCYYSCRLCLNRHINTAVTVITVHILWMLIISPPLIWEVSLNVTLRGRRVVSPWP